VATALAVPLALLAGPATAHATAPTPTRHLIDLTALDGGGGTGTANGINQHGDVVGDTNGHAFLYHNGQLTNLGTAPGDVFSTATDINRAGDIVGYGNDTFGNSHALLWHKGQLTYLGTLGGANSYATAINDRGDIVGYSAVADSPTLHAFRWRHGTMTDINATQPFSIARDINNRGVIAGDIATDSGNRLGARWLHGTPTPLGAATTTATGINARGHITGLANPTSHSYLFANGTTTDISAPGAGFVQANGLNDRDDIVGNSDQGAFVWHRGQLTILPGLANTISTTANRINNSGQIAGSAPSTTSGANPHAVLWTF
jgi:probable HAF family extracellular repeat protein